MADEVVLVGSIGQSVWRSEDGGQGWSRGKGALFMESDVRALLSLGNGAVLLGSETGLYRSEDTGQSWNLVAGFPADCQVWALHQCPGPKGRRLWAGVCPAALFYSDDEGQTWSEAPARWMRTCAGGALRTRVTSFLSNPQALWAGVEIDGLQRSENFGSSWVSCNSGLTSLDIHGLTALPGEGGSPGVLIAATNADCFRSCDGGESWAPLEVGKRFRWSYCRSVALDRDGRSLLVGNGSGPPGDGGALWRSPDGGATWVEEELPETPNSTIWTIAVGTKATWVVSVLGQIYRQPAGGKWQKIPREFGEIRPICLIEG